MAEMSNSEALERLRARIVRDIYLDGWREVWFFPKHNGVEGWQGTRDIMFVGLNPSTGRFPDKATTIFYDQLRHNGFADAHLSDVVKERIENTGTQKFFKDRRRMDRHKKYLREEIDILRPRIIVGMGNEAQGILARWFGSDERLQRIPHYSPRFPTAVKQGSFATRMKAIRDEYKRVGGSAKNTRGKF